MEIRTQKYEIFKLNETGLYKAHVFDYRLCRRMNKFLESYDYVFQEGDEGIFKFREDQIKQVKKLLGIKS